MRNIFTLLALLVFGTILSKNHAQTYSIYPTPQKVVETGEAIELTQQINVICESGIGEVTRNRMKEVLEEAGYTIAFSTNPSQTRISLASRSSFGVAVCSTICSRPLCRRKQFAPCRF